MTENEQKKSEEKKGEYFTKWIEENFIPCGIVYTTDKSKEILKRNNLTGSEFMRPFGDLKNIPFDVKINDNNYTLNDFRIDFFDYEDFKENDVNLEYYLNNCLNNKKNCPQFSLEKSFNDISDITKQMNYYAFNYFNEMEKIILEHCYFCESELYQQPLCSVYIISINDDIETINKLKQTFPILLIDTYYDKIISTLVLILNDKSDSQSFLTDNKTIQSNINTIKKLFLKEEVIYFEINGNIEKNLENNYLFCKYLHKLEENGKYFSEDNFNISEKGILLTTEEINILKNNINIFFQKTFREKLLELVKNLLDSNTQKDHRLLNIFPTKARLVNCVYFSTKKFLQPERDLYLYCVLLFYLRDYKNALVYIERLETKLKKQCQRLECPIVQLKVILKYICKKKCDFKESLDLYISNQIFETAKIPNKNKYFVAYRSFIILLKMLEDYDLKEAIKIIDTYNNIFLNFCCKLFPPLLFEKRSFYYLFLDKPNVRKLIFEILKITGQYFDKIKNNFLLKFKYQLNEFKYIYHLLNFEELSNPNYALSFVNIKKYVCNIMSTCCEQLSYIDANFKILCNNISLYTVFEGQILNSNGKSIYNLSDTGEDKKVAELFSKLIRFFQSNEDSLRNYSIPKIDQTSLVVIKEQDLSILKHKVPSNYYESFSKFAIPIVNIKYSLLTNEDLYILKLIDMITNNRQYGNYFINKEHIINKNEEIIIHFDLVNPLPIDIFAEDISPIIDNEKLVEYEHIKSSLQPKIRKTVSLKIKFKELGKITILGISLNIFSNIRVKAFFQYPLKHSYLYDSFDKRNENIEIILNSVAKKRKRRKFSGAHRINYKDKERNYSFEILDKDININISIPYLDEGIHLYQYELYYLPIKISNKFRINIKRFTIYLSSIRNTIISPKYIFHELDINEEKTIQIPIIPKILGNNYLEIIIKFESLNEDIEIKSYMLKVITHKSINIQVSDILMEKENLFERRRIIFDFDLQKTDKFTKMILDNNITCLLIGEKLLKSFEKDLEVSTNERYYKEIEILFQDSETKYIKDIFLSDDLIDEHNKEAYIFYISKLLEKDKNIIYQFQLETNDKKIKNFLYVYYPMEIIENMNYQESYLKKILRESTNMSYILESISSNENYLTVTLSINPKPFINFFKSNIFSLKIKIDEESNNFIWIGLKEFTINDFSNETIIKFSFIYSFDTLSTNEFNLNELNINQFLYEVTLNPLLKTVTFTNILKPIYIPIKN